MIYSFLVIVIRPVLKLFFGLKKYGAENIPKDEAVILCSNHIHWMDCVTLAVTNKRYVSFIAKKELFENKLFAWLLKALHGIPVDRQTSDMKAYKETLKRLKEGGIIGIFAQGTRLQEIDTKSAKSGVAMFALMSGAVVVPVNISATYKLFGEIKVRYGKPITLEEYTGAKVKTEVLCEITEKIMEKVSELGK